MTRICDWSSRAQKVIGIAIGLLLFAVIGLLIGMMAQENSTIHIEGTVIDKNNGSGFAERQFIIVETEDGERYRIRDLDYIDKYLIGEHFDEVIPEYKAEHL